MITQLNLRTILQIFIYNSLYYFYITENYNLNHSTTHSALLMHNNSIHYSKISCSIYKTLKLIYIIFVLFFFTTFHRLHNQSNLLKSHNSTLQSYCNLHQNTYSLVGKFKLFVLQLKNYNSTLIIVILILCIKQHSLLYC
ncbi:Hypothetical protein ERGA_CDS_00290 [Ehrlichia ruminantium str. Gardel]|nr:Hypothetical protein ERGA_CDS_00290 [Ehrlichia ruminantium str. Gardel]